MSERAYRYNGVSHFMHLDKLALILELNSTPPIRISVLTIFSADVAEDDSLRL
ncbi:MAG: hypothetical protein QXL85_07060 [Candidatus Bathyarchaeia archaeon]